MMEDLKELQSWLIVSRGGEKRIVHQKPTRWRPETGAPQAHETQWDETVYLMRAELVPPEEIDGPMVKALDAAPEEWEQTIEKGFSMGCLVREPRCTIPGCSPGPCEHMGMARWIAQEIFRRVDRMVPRNSYGPGAPLKKACMGSDVHLEVAGHVITIEVKEKP